MDMGTYAVEFAPKLQAHGVVCKPFRLTNLPRPLPVQSGIEPRG